ncbi:glycosyltransferase [Nocardioides sp. Kera G14]|uniref:glycosyltransferase n=1 Tax=Nocardioides sp. Kera G14 TaxID=2884264 RepID=UPI001D12B998|nr:glycosyltransferase [Nocardioides sp. Kera G14]UDY22791.1 glycosyltransferase [Nocardioides sp. Kera G14]
MLSALLLAAIVGAILSTILLLIPLPTRFGGGAWLWTKRFMLAVIGTVLLAAIGAAAVWLENYRVRTVEITAVVLLGASALWLPLTRRWNARAHLCWATNVALFVVYLAFMLEWTIESPLGWAGRVGAFVLLGLEAFAAVLSCAYLWELCDALGREHWARRSGEGLADHEVDGDHAHPFVSLHVPSYEEPPEMVIATLTSLKALDYDNYEIVAIDDNTKDEALWRPVEAWCRENGVKFAHLQDWPGYKSGALNYALQEMTDERAEVIGIIDSDYQIEPDFLRRTAPLFNDPAVGFLQTPQDYREWKDAPFFRQLYYSYKYFFTVSQPSRNERDGAIFAGTMGLIRREALESLGGWNEWCITEDAELSLRLLRAGWSGMHVDASYGHGLMPLSFEALKGQRFRWCFGGIQILRMHWRSMLPGARTRANALTNAQRWSYLSGALQWYGDLIALVFYFFLLGGAINIALGGGLLFRKLTPFLLAAIPVLMLLGFVRAVALVRRGTGATWRDAIGAFFIWQSTSLVVARASVQALFAKKAEFLRTPKTSEDASVLDAFRGNRIETSLALLGVLGIVAALFHPTSLSGPLLAALLLLPTIGYAMAPINSIAAQRQQLSPELEARRSSEIRRGQAVRRSAAAVGVVLVAGAAAAVVIGLLSPAGDNEINPPGLSPGEAQRRGGPSDKPSPSDNPSDVGATTGATTSSPTASGSAAPSSSASPSGGGSSSASTPSASTTRSTSPTPARTSATPTASAAATSSAAATTSTSTAPTPSATPSSSSATPSPTSSSATP